MFLALNKHSNTSFASCFFTTNFTNFTKLVEDSRVLAVIWLRVVNLNEFHALDLRSLRLRRIEIASDFLPALANS